jgi:hypothetical protein
VRIDIGSKRFSEGTNKLFPKWVTATIVIDGMLDRYGVYVYEDLVKHLTTNQLSVTVSFLPNDVFKLVPMEDYKTFIEIYNAFASWLHEKMGSREILDRYNFSFVDESTYKMIQQDLTSALNSYEDMSGVRTKECLRASLGVSCLCPMPMDLQKKLPYGGGTSNV